MTTPGSQSTSDTHQPETHSPAKRPTHIYYGVLALTVAMAVLLYLDRYAFSVVEIEIESDLSITETEMGDAVSVLFLVYGLAQVPAGWLADRLGPRSALTLFVAAWSLAIAGVGFSRSLATFVAARALLGLGQAGAYPTAAGLIKRWIPFKHRGFASGAVTMGGRAGALLTNILTPQLMGLFGIVVTVQTGLWRPIMVLYGAIGLAWAGLFYAWFRNTPREHHRVNAAELALIEYQPVAETSTSAPATAKSTPWLAIVSSLNVWLLCLVNFFTNVGWIFLATKLATYLRRVHEVSRDNAGWLTAIAALAGMFGCLAGGWVTDRLVRKLGLRWGRRGPGMLACGGAAAAYLACYAGQQSTAVVIVSAACAYFFADLVLGTVWATYQDIGSASVGVVLGFGNMCGNLGAWYFSKKIGNFAENGHWSDVMLIAAGSFACAMTCWLFIDARVPIVRPAAQSD